MVSNIQDGLKEIQVLRQAGEHSNIVKFLDCYLLQDKIHIAFELSPLGSLYDYSKKCREAGQPLAERTIVKWMYQVALGMQHLHKKDIYHRDLTPLNVLLFEADVVKICDLGISKKVIKDKTAAKTAIGNERFWAPEILSHKPYTSAVDVWNFASMLYFLCTNKTTVTSEDLNDTEDTLITAVRLKVKPQIGDEYS